MAKPDAVALAAHAANQRSIVERSAALPRMIWRHDGCAAIAASIVASALRRERAFDLPEFRRQAAPVGLGDERREHRRTAGRPRTRPRAPAFAPPALRARAACRRRGTRPAAPRASPTAPPPPRGIVRPVAGEHFHERAGEGGGERIGRPRERNRAGLLGGRADVEPARAHRRSPPTNTARRSAARRSRAPRRSARAPAGSRRRRDA